MNGVKHITVQKSLKRSIKSLVLMRLPKDPSPLQIIRYKRKERLSRLCAFVLTIVMMVGIGAQIGKLIDIVAIRKNVQSLQADNRLLEVSIDNLNVELMMKTQDTVICHLAQRDLGMIRLDEMQIMVIPVSQVHEDMTQRVSTGYQK